METDLTLGTPALLFPTVSLLLLAFTNRFLAIASIIRGLSRQFEEKRDPALLRQIDNLRRRLTMIRNMQGLGVMSLLFCVVCMFSLFADRPDIARWLFGFSLILMIAALSVSLNEIYISTDALHIHLAELEKRIPREPPREDG